MVGGSRIGDVVEVALTNGQTKIIELTEVKTYGIEGKVTTVKSFPLTFYPFSNIVSITKHYN